MPTPAALASSGQGLLGQCLSRPHRSPTHLAAGPRAQMAHITTCLWFPGDARIFSCSCPVHVGPTGCPLARQPPGRHVPVPLPRGVQRGRREIAFRSVSRREGERLASGCPGPEGHLCSDQSWQRMGSSRLPRSTAGTSRARGGPGRRRPESRVGSVPRAAPGPPSRPSPLQAPVQCLPPWDGHLQSLIQCFVPSRDLTVPGIGLFGHFRLNWCFLVKLNY